MTAPDESRSDRDLQREVDALSQRFAALSEQVLGAAGMPSSGLVAEVLQELSTAVEELQVSTGEIHAQNEALLEAQHQLDVEAARYRELFDLAPDGYLVTEANGLITEVNRAASDLLSSPGPALLQKPIIVFVEPEDRRLVLDGLRDAVERRDSRVVDLEARFAPPNHPTFPASVHLTASAPTDGAPGTVRWLVRDVSRRVKAEQALATSEARYRLLAESAADVVIVADMTGRITYASPSTLSTIDTDPRALEGAQFESLVHPDDHIAVRPLQDEAFVGRRIVSATCRVRRGDGQYLAMEARAAPLLDTNGNVSGLRYALRDVHDREEARVALQAALVRERESAADLRDANEAKDALLLAAAHDLTTPVGAVAGLAELLVEHPDLPEGQIRRIARNLAETSSLLRGILVNLLDAERVIGGHVVVQRKRTNLTGLIAESAARLGLTEAGAVLPTDTVIADVDSGLTARIVDNLLGNAVRHTPRGSRVQVGLIRTDNSILIVVDDEGPGVPDEAKETIFEAFQRQPGPAIGGLGLGLFIVRRFAQLQGGRAWVEDTPAGGASFRVLLPATSDR